MPVGSFGTHNRKAHQSDSGAERKLFPRGGSSQAGRKRVIGLKGQQEEISSKESETAVLPPFKKMYYYKQEAFRNQEGGSKDRRKKNADEIS